MTLICKVLCATSADCWWKRAPLSCEMWSWIWFVLEGLDKLAHTLHYLTTCKPCCCVFEILMCFVFTVSRLSIGFHTFSWSMKNVLETFERNIERSKKKQKSIHTNMLKRNGNWMVTLTWQYSQKLRLKNYWNMKDRCLERFKKYILNCVCIAFENVFSYI